MSENEILEILAELTPEEKVILLIYLLSTPR